MNPDHHVHVWTLPTVASAEVLDGFERLLATDEAVHASQIRSLRQRESFVVTRAALRTLLGRFLAIEPHQIHLNYGPYGKPELPETENLRFNVSHSGQLAAIALTRGCDVGIDL